MDIIPKDGPEWIFDPVITDIDKVMDPNLIEECLPLQYDNGAKMAHK